MGHLNINSIPNKFDGIMSIAKNNLDVFLISETKIDRSFPDAQFYFQGYSKPHRKDRTLGPGGGLLMYINQNIASRKLKEHNIPENAGKCRNFVRRDKFKKTKMGINRNLSPS